MKNIHVLPTDKPSRLWINTITGELVLDEEPNTLHSQNIYITSDEEIKEGDWYFDGTDLVHKKTKYNDALVDGNKDAKKIILTTDQDLIKYGVQAIDGEFLQWFVENPSCEEVEVKKECCGQCDERLCEVYDLGIKELDYKIIIPKEEPKQETTADYIDRHIVQAMVEVAKQKMYSEEEVINIIYKIYDEMGISISLEDVLKQLKK